jgi:hypothetical protein
LLSKLDVSIGTVRNSRTACRNHAAPSMAAFNVPPSLWMNLSSAPTVGCSRDAASRRCASIEKAEKRHNCGRRSEGEATTIALCRVKVKRSSARSETPLTQRCTVSSQTPSFLATSAGGSPPCTRATASNTRSAPLTFPGRVSHGRMRSRRLQLGQRASATDRTVKPEAVASLRCTRALVARGAGPLTPQCAHRHSVRRRLASSGSARNEA